MDCCVQGRAGVPAGQLRRLAVLAVTGVRGWGDRVEEHMSYAWLQMLTRAKEEQRRHLGEVGRVVDVDAEEGEGEGDDASSMRSSRSGGSKGKVGRPRKAPKLPAKSGGQPLAAQPPPAAHVDAWAAAQAGAMPEWQKRAVAAEGEVLLLRGKLREAEQRAQEAERRATAAERERDVLRAQARKPQPKPGQQQEVGRAEGGGGSGRGGVSDGVKYLMAGSQAWKSQAEKVKGELSAVAATARLLHGGDVSSVPVRDPPPPPPCPPGQLSCQGSTATGHTYSGAEGARIFFFISLAHFVHFAPQHYP